MNMVHRNLLPSVGVRPDDVILRLRGLRKAFKGSVAVDGIDLDVRQGEFLTLLGPSGSGKTTTLRMIAGFERPDAGLIELDGVDVAGRPPYARSVNTVFQDYALFPHMSVLDNVAYGLHAKGLKKADARVRADDGLRSVQLGHLADRRPTQLSGGQRQRVALARAIVNCPKILLLDEPLGALDLQLRRDMQLELKRIHEKLGITFLYVTHDQEEALTMSDRIAIFERGAIVQVDPPRAVYAVPSTRFVAGFVGTSTLLERDGAILVLRPEQVRVVPEWAAAAEGLCDKGVLEDEIFAGMYTRWIIRLDDGKRVEALADATVNGGLRPRPGQRVAVGFAPDCARLAPEAGA